MEKIPLISVDVTLAGAAPTRSGAAATERAEMATVSMAKSFIVVVVICIG